MRPSISRATGLGPSASAPLLPHEIHETLSRAGRRTLGWLVLALLGVMWLALLSWSAGDPGVARGTGSVPRNWLGLPGAYLADAWLQALGVATFAALWPPMLWGLALLAADRPAGTGHGRPRRPVGLGAVVLPPAVVALAGAASTVGPLPGWPLPYGLGGAVGDVLAHQGGLVSGTFVAPDVARAVIGLALGLLGVAGMAVASGVRPPRVHLRNDGHGAQPRGVDRHDRGPHGRAWPTLDGAPVAPSAGEPAPVRSAPAAPTGYWDDDYRWDDEQPDDPDTPPPTVVPSPPSPPAARLADVTAPDDDPYLDVESGAIAARFAPRSARVPADAPHALRGTPAHVATTTTAATTAPVDVSGGRVRAGADAAILPSLALLPRGQGFAAGAPAALVAHYRRGTARIVEDALAEFGVRGTIHDVTPGPVVTVLSFEPAPGVRPERLMALADDIARRLGVTTLRIGPIAGSACLTIELPNPHPRTIRLRDCLDSQAWRAAPDALPLALGASATGTPVVVDLADMPHLLVSGRDRGGSATGLDAMILSLLYRHGPDTCRLLLIDPRRVDLAAYEGIPHLVTPVIGDPHKALTALGWCVREMEQRLERMAMLGVPSAEAFNARVRIARLRGERLQRTVQTGYDPVTGAARYERADIPLAPMPVIVIVIEELSDLMAVAGRDVEGAITRLATATRRVGIHLVVATRRATDDIVTAAIRDSLPARLTYRAPATGPWAAADVPGAEHLSEGADSLLVLPDLPPIRVHGAEVTAEEALAVAEDLRERAPAAYVPGVLDGAPYAADAAPDVTPTRAMSGGPVSGAPMSSGPVSSGPVSRRATPPIDAVLDRAVAIALREGAVSRVQVQAALKISTAWAVTLIARLEADGIVGPPDARGVHHLCPQQTRAVA
jgi:S-DNA-T family DNA segregation ATPase FtsK/SpoIIIE